MQTSNYILLIKPSSFLFNEETALTNAFQIQIKESEAEIKHKKLHEFDKFVETLASKGVHVLVFEDTQFPEKPDAIFPNNWVSFHSDGTVILYPMCAVNRRLERRQDIIESLKKQFVVNKIIDLSKYEKEEKYLEGTGSIIFDRSNKLAYACLSPRTDKELFIEVCAHLNYKPIYFYAHDKKGKEIYHTNVMMCIGNMFSVICLDAISDSEEREMVLKSLTESGHQIIDISFEQMNNFAGNMLEIQSNTKHSILALSQSAFDSLTELQKMELEKYTTLVPLVIKTIETIGGGSARCMIAEIFLPSIE